MADNDFPLHLRAGSILGPRVPGHNVDKIDLDAGMAELAKIGYTGERTQMVILYALQCWGRGEEGRAEKNAIDQNFYGIDLTSWRRVLAAAMAGAEDSNG